MRVNCLGDTGSRVAGLVGLETFYSRLYSAGSFFTVHNQDLEMCVFTLHSEGLWLRLLLANLHD